ncbi:5'-nucleotidase, exopolyphosphatase, 3'-nucleotidase [Thalassoporum mexicanum PCC 7367]|uniref:5'/3'-nucleotidase SurE n=1 Tax=Thalassoporum mexicanum TaxID=3457544 RepID=UPI00029FA60B|nr:5'/3'-nucleotidase SurE [Pseudanabaena sp. PCC 7367]AFY68845.1 5'-nucleotidase, exopolyphosphatase, 3'-nucleotidase [Pseudanabaena sp. PCC 7367]
MLVLTNDDGIDAPGIRVLYEVATSLDLPPSLLTDRADRPASNLKSPDANYAEGIKTPEVVLVAPDRQYSGCGHQVTTYHPIGIERRSDTEFAISGTPADCVRVAYGHLAKSADGSGSIPIKLVLSGINAGGNLGIDNYISGTVAAVREATMLGIPAIALSHYRHKGREFDWPGAANLTRRVLDQLLQKDFEPGTFWNVNLPHPMPGSPEPELVYCNSDNRPLPIEFKVNFDQHDQHDRITEYVTNVGVYENRDRTPACDIDVCFSGNVAITKIRL